MVAGARWAPFKMLQNITCITTFKVAILDKFYLSVVLNTRWNYVWNIPKTQ